MLINLPNWRKWNLEKTLELDYIGFINYPLRISGTGYVIRDFISHLQGSSVLILKRPLGHEVILVCLNFSSSEECISKEDYLSDYEEITILWPARYFISIMDLAFYPKSLILIAYFALQTTTS